MFVVTEYKSSKFKASPGIAIRRIRGELFFITPATAELHTLNESGVTIWDSLMSGHTPDEVIAELVENTDGHPEEIRADLLSWINTLIDKGIIEIDN